MKRREFIALLGSAVVARSLGAQAQQSAVPMVGVLNPGSAATSRYLMDAILGGLSQAGYVEGRNVAIEYRWADGHYDRLPETRCGASCCGQTFRQVAV